MANNLSLLGAGPSAGGTSSLLPTAVTGLTAWWDVTQETPVADGANIAPLLDRSGNSRPLSAGSGTPKYYSAIKNGNPIARTNGLNNFYDFTTPKTLGNLISASAFTIYFIAKVTVVTDSATIENNDCLLGTYSAARHFGLYFRTSNGLTAQSYDGTTVKSVTVPYTSNTWAIIRMQLSGGVLSVRLNNGAPVTVSSVNNVDATTLAQQLYIMSGPVAYTGADLGEGACFNTAVSSGDDAGLLAYWNLKWAIY